MSIFLRNEQHNHTRQAHSSTPSQVSQLMALNLHCASRAPTHKYLIYATASPDS